VKGIGPATIGYFAWGCFRYFCFLVPKASGSLSLAGYDVLISLAMAAIAAWGIAGMAARKPSR
jgi:hypothetical protein